MSLTITDHGELLHAIATAIAAITTDDGYTDDIGKLAEADHVLQRARDLVAGKPGEEYRCDHCAEQTDLPTADPLDLAWLETETYGERQDVSCVGCGLVLMFVELPS